jgi:hypothetical protein
MLYNGDLKIKDYFSAVKWVYSGQILFCVYFVPKDIFEQSKCPQLFLIYPRMSQKLLHPNNINNKQKCLRTCKINLFSEVFAAIICQLSY